MAEAEAIHCPHCGKKATTVDVFCIGCGKAIPGASAVTSTVPGRPDDAAFGEGVAATAAGETADSAAKPKTPAFAAGEIIDNKYRIDRKIGEGGMGVVYLAQDVHTRVEVVLKAVRPELAHRKDVRERLLTEGRTVARIDHPNVVHLNAIVEDETGLWLVMQYIDGESLDATILRYQKDGQSLPVTVAIDIFRQILKGVGAVHREGVIHRDMKPANVLIRQKDGVAKVTDFGIAKPEDQAREGIGKTKGVIGSLWYMSPEQVQGQRDLDKRVDIYALGILLYELLVGEVPFSADSSYELMRLHVEEPLPKTRAKREDLPAWIDELLARACAKKRDDRFSSCEEFLAAIDAYQPARPTAVGITRLPSDRPASMSEPAASTAAGTSLTRPGADGRSRAGLVVGLVALVTVGAVGFVLFGGDKDPPKTPASAVATSPAPITPLTSSTPSAAAPIDPLDQLVGTWRSEAGTRFSAVRVENAVEFRIVDAKELAPQDYRDNEARFILRHAAASTYLVEDKIRPRPPGEASFDARSRLSCQEVWTEVDGKPLQATFDGTRLSVSFAKIGPEIGNFYLQGDVVLGCVKLRQVPASVIKTSLSREE